LFSEHLLFQQERRLQKLLRMAKKTSDSIKVSFGKRREGKAQKRRGPKDKHTSKYRGQGK
jgi:hypothetical protein